ncbi:MAG: PadR family transcriptional regulator [Lachnospiraceae bacterium]|nr:PadR family transcriptional regulator [Lachnospiraceae bacterium]
MALRNSFKSGSCEMLILHILKNRGDCYAYEISQMITKLTEGKLTFPEGSLYPAFYRMIDNHYISDYKKQTGRRMVKVYYHIEAAGEERLKHLTSEYYATAESIEYILKHDFSMMEGTNEDQ